ncbi:hypothetical protein K438DRAFT_2028479 [Mycena galopus ATCC 62051]|nr:hypothetical protein K438DRAFT_2028479 [Mycena galopus ATCC 62051]
MNKNDLISLLLRDIDWGIPQRDVGQTSLTMYLVIDNQLSPHPTIPFRSAPHLHDLEQNSSLAPAPALTVPLNPAMPALALTLALSLDSATPATRPGDARPEPQNRTSARTFARTQPHDSHQLTRTRTPTSPSPPRTRTNSAHTRTALVLASSPADAKPLTAASPATRRSKVFHCFASLAPAHALTPGGGRSSRLHRAAYALKETRT